jgi:solute carrier family 6 GABA transporter-like protein 6/8/11/12/13
MIKISVLIFLGAFLFPYLICALVGGVPLFYIEVALGQFMGVGGVGTWSICPLFQGKMGCFRNIAIPNIAAYNCLSKWSYDITSHAQYFSVRYATSRLS